MAQGMRLQPILTKGTFKGKTWVSKALAGNCKRTNARWEFTHKPRRKAYHFYYASLADVRKVNDGRTGIRRA